MSGGICLRGEMSYTRSPFHIVVHGGRTEPILLTDFSVLRNGASRQSVTQSDCSEITVHWSDASRCNL